MLPKEITYTDFNGEEKKETFYFNLTEAELAKMQLSSTASLDVMIKNLIETDDREKIVEIFDKIILMSYGERSIDGKYFKKEDSIRGKYADDFKASGAYNALFMELVTDTNAVTDFINGILPAKLKEMNAANAENHPALK